jgi:hypothetical protein
MNDQPTAETTAHAPTRTQPHKEYTIATENIFAPASNHVIVPYDTLIEMSDFEHVYRPELEQAGVKQEDWEDDLVPPDSIEPYLLTQIRRQIHYLSTSEFEFEEDLQKSTNNALHRFNLNVDYYAGKIKKYIAYLEIVRSA